jgi:hypothetical protein
MKNFRSSCFLLAVLLSSCSSGGVSSYGGEEGKKVADLISNLDDDLQESPKTVFATGSVPQPNVLKKYLGMTYSLVGKPSVDGTTATARVAIERSATGDKVGEMDWTFVKEGDAWRIKNAPLP